MSYIIHNYIIHMCIYNCCWVHEVTIKNIAYVYIIILYIIYICNYIYTSASVGPQQHPLTRQFSLSMSMYPTTEWTLSVQVYSTQLWCMLLYVFLCKPDENAFFGNSMHNIISHHSLFSAQLADSFFLRRSTNALPACVREKSWL